MLVLSIYFLSGKQNKQIINWTISLLVIAALLFSPHAHLHDILLLAIPALLTLPGMAGEPAQPISLFLWQWILYLFPLISWFCFFLSLFGLGGNILLTLIMAVLFICALRQVFIEKQDLLKQGQ